MLTRIASLFDLLGKLKDVKNIPECCLEAALYSHRATLEAKMPLAVKQDRVR